MENWHENFIKDTSGSFSLHNSMDKDKADEFTLEACNEVKAQDITVYTIGFGDAITAQTEQLLRDCASESKNYLPADNAQELQLAFDKISGEINSVYLSK